MSTVRLSILASSILLAAVGKAESAPSEALRQASPDYYAQLQSAHSMFVALKKKYPNSSEKERLTRLINMLYMSAQSDDESRSVYLRDMFSLVEQVMRQAVWAATVGRESSQRAWQQYNDAYGEGAAETEYEHRRTCSTDHSVDELDESDDADARPVADHRERFVEPPVGAGPQVPEHSPQDYVDALVEVNGWLNAVVSTVLGPEASMTLIPDGVGYMRYSVDDQWYNCFSAEQAIEVQTINNRASKVKRARTQAAARGKILDALSA